MIILFYKKHTFEILHSSLRLQRDIVTHIDCKRLLIDDLIVEVESLCYQVCYAFQTFDQL